MKIVQVHAFQIFDSRGDPTVQAAKNLAVFGNEDGSGNAIVGGLTTDMIEVSVQRYTSANQTLGPCDCSLTGCDASAGGLPPDFITADMPNGYPFQPLFWGFRVDPILLKPHVRVPYGGT